MANTFPPVRTGVTRRRSTPPGAIAALRWYEGLYCTDKVVGPQSLNEVSTDTIKDFTTGVAGMYLTGPYSFATFDATAIKGKYIVVAPPPGPKSAATLAENTSIYLMSGSDKTGPAEKLAAFMISPAGQRIGMTGDPAATIVRLPINRTVDAAKQHHGDPRWALADRVYRRSGHYEPDFMPDWQSYRQAASDAINGVIAHCGDPAKALHGLAKTYDAMLADHDLERR